MELPFAVESPDRSVRSTLNRSTASSLVTASSQGSSLVLSEGGGALSHGNTYAPQQHPHHFDAYPTEQQPQPTATHHSPDSVNNTETIDFTYVTVCEEDADDEVDVVIDNVFDDFEASASTPKTGGDVLALLLSDERRQDESEALVVQCEQACADAQDAANHKLKGDLQSALDSHTHAAKAFRAAATDIRERDASLANSLLLLSQSQARSALALKRILKHQPNKREGSSSGDNNGGQPPPSQKDRLLATVRGALVTRNEADISDSTFLGRATSSGNPSKQQHDQQQGTAPEIAAEKQAISTTQAISTSAEVANANPVDDMMELEKELRDMDMALEMGNSIASLGGRTQSRMKHSTMEEGSFMVVPPGSGSYMSSSTLWASGVANPATRPSGTAGVRARANRVQPPRSSPPHHGVMSPPPLHSVPPQPPHIAAKPPHGGGLESSWWGHPGTTTTASQVLASSIMSGRSGAGGDPAAAHGQHSTAAANQQPPADTKQLMRFLDSLKTLGDENAALLREVEEAEAARAEARAAREQMKRFKADYGKRFEALKAALEKFRKGYPDHNGGGETNPVTNSDYVRTASVSEELQKKDKLIRKLTLDLKKEKEESKKKDGALRKYESFYREVKARSAQKAAQRQKEAQQRQRSNALVPPRAPR